MEPVTCRQLLVPTEPPRRPDVASGLMKQRRPIAMERAALAITRDSYRHIPNTRCKAVKRNGEKCKAWAVRGAVVCVAHGGNAPQVRAAAVARLGEAQARSEMERAYSRYQRDLERWQRRRVALTASLLGIPPERVTPGDLMAARYLFGGKDVPRKPEITDARYRLPSRAVRPRVIKGEVIR